MVRLIFVLITFFVYLDASADECGLDRVSVDQFISQQVRHNGRTQTQIAGFVEGTSGQQFEFSFALEFEPDSQALKLTNVEAFEFTEEKVFSRAILPHQRAAEGLNVDQVIELHYVRLSSQKKSILARPYINFEKTDGIWKVNSILFTEIREL